MAELNTNPKVYVGTYAKYNNGSIEGQWVDLTQFANYSDFVKHCKTIHKDESYPELMIQDCENFPDGLSCGEWLSEQEYNDIISEFKEENNEVEKYQIIDYSEKSIAVVGDTKPIKDELKKLGGKFNGKLSCGAGWIFSKKAEAELRQFLQCGNIEKSTNEYPYKEMLNEYIATCDEWYKQHHKKHSIGAIKFNEGYYIIEKPSIENAFCWADEGDEYESYKYITSNNDRLANYFLMKNLNEIDRHIKNLQDEDDCRPMYLGVNNHNHVYFYRPYCEWQKHNETDRELTQEDKDKFIAGLKWSRDLFEKRLKTYLKKYGTSKLRTWTYWRDA